MKIWVSLTTTPSRIDKMEKTLQSLLNQSYPAEKIIINIPYRFGRTDEEYVIPDWLESMMFRHRTLKINRTILDYGAITKLLPTLELVPYEDDVWIATADDDIDYLPHILELYARMSEVFTAKPAMGLSGCFLRTMGIRGNNLKLVLEASRKTEGVDVIEGYSLPVYHRSFFQPNFMSYVAKCLENKDLKKSDDIVISNWLRMNKIQALQVGVPWCSRNRLWGEKRILEYGNEKDALHLQDDNAEKYLRGLEWLSLHSLSAFDKKENLPPGK
jgi:hypothetical protein